MVAAARRYRRRKAGSEGGGTSPGLFRKEDEPLSRADDCSAADSEAASSCEARILTPARGAAYRRSLEISSTHRPAALAYAFSAIGCVVEKEKIQLREDWVESRRPGISPEETFNCLEGIIQGFIIVPTQIQRTAGAPLSI